MWFGFIGISFHTAPVEMRERLSFDGNIANALRRLVALDGVMEGVIVSTCNRVEVYGLLQESTPDLLKGFLRDYHHCDDSLNSWLYQAEGEQAVAHLCRVAAGMESMVLGEPQIFGQVKDAYRLAAEQGAVGRVLKQLFPRVFSVVKAMRTKSRIGNQHVSVGFAAVERARQIFGDLGKRCVMVLGAGEMGELTARSLRTGGADRIFIANRTFERAVGLAERIGATPIMLHEVHEYLPDSDIIVSAVDAKLDVLSIHRIEPALGIGTERQVLIIDIAVPRSVAPQVGELTGVQLVNIDDLRHAADKGLDERRRAVERAEAVLESRLPGITAHLAAGDMIHTLASIRQTAEQIRRDLLEQSVARLAMPPEHRETVEALTKSLVRKILSQSEVKFREYSNSLRQ